MGEWWCRWENKYLLESVRTDGSVIMLMEKWDHLIHAQFD